MNGTAFTKLCEGFCRAAEIPLPNLEPDPQGNTILVLTLDDVEFTLSHEPAVAPREALLSVPIGLLPRENALAILRELMDVNSYMAWTRGCSFGRDPLTEHIMLYSTYSLQDGFGGDLYVRVCQMAEIVQCWRVLHLVPPEGAETQQLPPESY